jgi:hypothetical protein
VIALLAIGPCYGSAVGSDEFDEEHYLRANPDVAVMVARGLFKSPLDHWQRAGSLEHAAGRRRSGFYEHDLLYDEETYLRHNPDVVRLLRARLMGSGYEHWMRHGRTEFSRGRRHAPFVAGVHRLRPFRLPLPEGGVLLAGPSEAPSLEPGPLKSRHGDENEQLVDPSAVTFTEPIRIVDACHREATVRLALARLAAGGSDSRRPRPLVLSNGATPLLASRDAGMQAFFFAAAEDANELSMRARALRSKGDEPAFIEAVTAFAIARLHRPADAAEPFAGFFLESLTRQAGNGFDASGWFSPPGEETKHISVWCPDTGECALLEPSARIDRPDVRAALEQRGTPVHDAPHGFVATLPLPLASATIPARLVFGLTLKSGVPRWFEFTDAKRLLSG